MNIYHLIKMMAGNRMPASLKIFGLWGMHVSRRRLLGLYLDPVLACNLRCRMCYFSDEAQRKARFNGGSFQKTELDQVEKAFFHRALKLQIGCGAEPTLYPDLQDLVRRGKRAGIQYISITTNGQLIASGRVNLTELVAAGLNEITLSAHGMRAETYEQLMPGADFANFEKLVGILRDIKATYPDFKIRLNFTANAFNLHDLEADVFWPVWRHVQPDIIQLRPVQKLGETAWTDFDLEPLKAAYDQTIGCILNECRRRSIVCIAPTLTQIDEVASEQDGVSALIEDMTYCYVSPRGCYQDGFDLDHDTYESYHRRMHTGRRLFRMIWKPKTAQSPNISKKLNYDVSA